MLVAHEESELIAKVLLNNDQYSFGLLVQQHQQSIRQYCRRLSAPDIAIADDIAQETFIQAFKKIQLFQGNGKFISWLFRIAYFQYLQYLRSLKRFDLLDENEHPSVEIIDLTITSDLEKAMEQLKVNERACITLQFNFGYTQEEVATLLGLPLGTVKSHVKRGKDKLTQILGVMSNDSPQNITGVA